MEHQPLEEVVRSFYEAFDRRDVEAAERLLHEDVVVEETPGFNPNAGVYRGRDEFRRYFDSWFKVWKSVATEVVRIEWGRADQIALALRVTVVGRDSDIEMTDDWGHLLEVRDGRLSRATLYRTPEEAFEVLRTPP